MAPIADVPFERILGANKEPGNWLTYSGTTVNQRHSALTQITPANAKDLALKWVFQSKSLEKHEVTPLVVDGVMYTVQGINDVFALDAATGKTIWTDYYKPDAAASRLVDPIHNVNGIGSRAGHCFPARGDSSLTEFIDTTRVSFRELDRATIERYVARESPLDCAGGFKSEGLGITLCESIDSADPSALIAQPWKEILLNTKLTADSLHVYTKEVLKAEEVTHARFHIYPDGGVARLRLFGTLARRLK